MNEEQRESISKQFQKHARFMESLREDYSNLLNHRVAQLDAKFEKLEKEFNNIKIKLDTILSIIRAPN